MYHTYVKFDDLGNIKYCPNADWDGSICGHVVVGLSWWFDENPEERKRLGWVKWIHHTPQEVIEYDPQTQNVEDNINFIDEYTCEDTFAVSPKPEKQLWLEELLESMNIYIPKGKVILDTMGGVVVP